MTTNISNRHYANVTNGDLNFSNISLNEIDTFNTGSSVSTFVSSATNPSALTAGADSGFFWSTFSAQAYSPTGAGATETLNFAYDITVTDPTQFITAIDSSYVADLQAGDGVLTAIESIYDANNHLLGTQSFSSNGVTSGPVQLAIGVQAAHVTLQIVETANSAGSIIDMSQIAQYFIQTPGAQLGCIGDFVFNDVNGNGIQDSSDTGIAGVTVDLLNSAGTIVAVTTTNAAGAYKFAGVVAGTYQVQFVAPTGDSFTLANQGGNPGLDSNANQTTGISGPITLTAGQTDLTIDAGLIVPVQPACIGDTVFFDANGNGIQDNGETGVAGVTVDLLNANGTSVLAVTTTNAAGNYKFANVAAGTYEVQFIAPTGDNFTLANQGNNPAIDSNANQTTGITAPITLAAGQTDLTIDAGLVAQTGCIGDTVFFDANGNGIQDNGETGVAGVTVDLLNANGTSVLAVTTTNAAGNYKFGNVAAGTYEVQFIAPTGDNFTLANQGNNPAIDSNANQTTGITAPITLTAGQTDLTIDAGLVAQTGCIGDTVFFDANGNGIQDNGETGVAGVTVDLLNANGTSVLAVTTTNAAGNYKFGNVAAGTYEVQFIAPTGDNFTLANQGNNPAIDSNANQTTGITAPITLTAGQTDLTIDAGLVAKTGCIGDTVFFDANGNGIQDNGETGVAGVTVDLLNANGTSVLAVTTTNAAGNYKFGNVAAGTYEVQFVAPAADKFTLANQGNNPAIDSNANQTTGITGPITLAAGQTDLTIDAGLVAKQAGFVVNKMAGKEVINAGCQETYTISLTNTGETPLVNLSIKDNIGTAANPVYVTPTFVTNASGHDVGDTNNNGILDPGETFILQVTTTPSPTGSAPCATVSHTCSGSYLTSGNTAWFNCSFKPTSTKDGTSYSFRGVSCDVKGQTVKCPDSEITFSNSCKHATTVYNAGSNCWITTLPANCTPGNVFVTGCPTKVPSGCDFTNATAKWSISESGNNCGSSSLDFGASCKGFSRFDVGGNNGSSDYNKIGVKVCDNDASYGNGGSLSTGYGYDGSGYDCSSSNVLNSLTSRWSSNVYQDLCSGRGSWYGNSDGYCGTQYDNAGTPCNQYTAPSSGCGGYYGGSGTSAGCGTPVTTTCYPRNGVKGDVSDTVTATIQNSYTGQTLTASDTADIVVLNSKNNVSVDGYVPTCNVVPAYGQAQTLEFTYNPGDTISLSSGTVGYTSGHNGAAMAFLNVVSSVDKHSYFQGEVASGEKFLVDATINSLTNTANSGSAALLPTGSGQGIWANIYTSQAAFQAGAAPVQTDTLVTSGSMTLGDTIGSLKLIGYVGTSGGHLAS